ncbi:galactokinase [Formosa agariphila KMM 3901]|uniref:Galactokinase n=1 Tax=Formosa agariphila (strain DSM 15362 / KCTC 12365 / LMG 23005 / KMM 3901 / M-2Alg 35-1) TaxID=1347342 RepID=T2KIG1_FORAG|nr:galactokinase [Formosa agariphila]CDF78662.1 galactokinase [Formosa agariphila KMM 3901]
MNTTLIDTVKISFLNTFKKEPILIFSPGRINIIGEHTDYNDGFVFPAAVNKGIVAAIQKSDAEVSSAFAIDKNERVEFSLENLKPFKEGSWENYILGVVSEIQNRNKIIGNFDIVFGGDIPGGAGMSSSAALENSVVFGLNELFNLGLSKYDMILISQKAEHNYVGVKCGIMDQYASMFGVEDHALLLDCRTVKASPFKIDFKDYELLLINTNVKHSLSDSAYNDRRSVCESVSELLNIKALRDASEFDLDTIKDQLTPENYQKALFVIQENARAVKASKAMKSDDLQALGQLIYASHEGLQKQYKVSCDELDFLVAETKSNANILGARMMGGGFGGCTINLIAKAEVNTFKDYISEAYQNKFNKACSIYEVKLSDGTHIIN